MIKLEVYSNNGLGLEHMREVYISIVRLEIRCLLDEAQVPFSRLVLHSLIKGYIVPDSDQALGSCPC